MRNMLVFKNKRDHIIQVLNAAYLDAEIWKEAIMQKEQTAEIFAEAAPTLNSIQEILPHDCELYCVVDASWKSPNEKISIGWSLCSKEGTPRLQGSTAMEPTSSPLVAEAMAMWTAVQQLHILSYTKVTFLGDCLQLMRLLQDRAEGKHVKEISPPELINVVHDIRDLAARNTYSFLHVSRKLIVVVDKLAKEARLYDKSYVIFWLQL